MENRNANREFWQPLHVNELHAVHSDLTDPTTRMSLAFKSIKDVLAELREMIFTHELCLPHNNKAPDLLVALAKEPELYAEAQAIYQRINVNLTL